MNGEDPRQNERQNLLTRLLDAVKQCQVRFGGRSELATDSDSRVSCLCATWEAVLQHGMKKNNKALSALSFPTLSLGINEFSLRGHMTEKAGLGKVTDFFTEVKHLDSEPAFWQFVKEHLTKHEIQRFQALKHISSDMGRGRAWLRACLNEHSLERYMHMLIEKEDLISQYYHDWAFMCDQERNSMLPTMSAGLGSILFAITIDRPELNKAYQNTVHVSNSVDASQTVAANDEPRAIIAEDTSASTTTKKEKKKKKKVANLVSFDEDGNSEVNHGRHSSVTSAGSSSITDDKCPDTPSSAPTDDQTAHDEETTPTVKELQAEAQEEKEDQDKDKTAAEAPAPSAVVEEGRQRTESQSSGDRAGTGSGGRVVLQAQCSVASLSSVFSATSIEEGAASKSSTGSVTSLDNDIGNCILTPVHPGVEYVSQASSFTADNPFSDASSDMSVFTRDVDSAALALAMAQKGLDSVRTDDGGNMEGMPDSMDRYMTHEELRQAVVRMMVKKDEMEAEKLSLQALLEEEMESSSMLRADIADLQQAALQQQELDQSRVNKLQSENELLKHQLKKYVNAVQLLRTEGASDKDEILGIKLDDSQPSIPPAKPAIDYSHEAAEYEQKLIQVAEMHGELMEFNEMLHRQLNAKDAVLRQLRQELVSLRGPLPYNEHQLEESANSLMESVSIQSRTLINIWIPSAFMRGSSSDQYHVYQVYVRIRDEEWNVFRRYSQFLDMHTRLKKVYPSVGRFNFPPKKSMGSRDPKVVEGRRHAFQSYLRSVINLLQEKNPELCADTCKAKLVALLPFFGDLPEPADKKSKRKRQHQHQQQARQSVSASNASSPVRGAGAAAAAGSSTQYQGPLVQAQRRVMSDLLELFL